MPTRNQGKSTSIHRKVRVSSANQQKEERSQNGNLIAHFAQEPISESLQISDTKKSEKISTDKITIKAEQQSVSKNSNNLISGQTSQQIKEQEIAKAIDLANRSITKPRKRSRKHPPMEFGFKKFALAFACAAVVVFGIIYLIESNSPDVSTKVAAIENGISVIYPKYIPRGYGPHPTGVTSENGKVVMEYKNLETGGSFSITEEVSDWTSSDLYENYVKKEFGDDYNKTEDSGIVVYTSTNNTAAVWMDGGVLIKIKVTSGTLTKKQITTIATEK